MAVGIFLVGAVLMTSPGITSAQDTSVSGSFFCTTLGWLTKPLGFCGTPVGTLESPTTEDAPVPPPVASVQSSEPATATTVVERIVVQETPVTEYVTNEFVTNPTTIIQEVIEREIIRERSNNIDTSNFVTLDLFYGQVDRIFESIREDINESTPSTNFTELTVTDTFTLTGGLSDGTSLGANGMVLLSTGTGVEWVATSSLDISGGGGSSLFTDAGATTYLTSVSDNMAIGTTSANATLTVAGDINIDAPDAVIRHLGSPVFVASTTPSTIAIGRYAGENFGGVTESQYNIAIGEEAGRNASTSFASESVFIGYQAGYNNTGYRNVIAGTRAGRNNNGGDFIVLIGGNAGENNSGDSLVGIGSNALQFNSGTDVVALGNGAGRDNSQDNLVAIGAQTGFDNTGANAILIGELVGENNEGDNVNMLGEAAGRNNTGDGVNLIGRYAGYFNAGSYSDFIGFEAGARMSASSSVVLGSNALRGGAGFPSSLNASTLNNTVIGYSAGFNVQTGGDNNLLIGYRAADSLTTGSNNIIIGYDVEAPSGTGSNQLNIGNAIFGTGLTATGTDIFTGNISIGATQPFFATTSERLTLAGGGMVANAPTDPVLVGQYSGVQFINGMTIVDDYAYMVDDVDGLVIVDVSDVFNPTEVVQFTTGGFPTDVEVVGDYAYVAQGNSFNIYNISDPTNPIEVHEFDDGGFTRDIEVRGQYAYINEGNSGLEILNIADPSAPYEVVQYDDGGSIRGIAVQGNYVYAADSTEGLEIIDISDPANPVEVGQSVSGGLTSDRVFVRGQYAYVTSGTAGLTIFDVTDPTNPTEVGNISDGGTSQGVTVAGQYAYVADGADGLEIIDISDPANPVEVGQIYEGGPFARYHQPEFYRGYVFVADINLGGLRVFDVGGSTVSSLYAGALGATQANFESDVIIGGDSRMHGGLNVGSDVGIGGTLSITGSASSSLFATNTNPSLLVVSGNVGIGTTTPTTKLTVAGVITPDANNTHSLGDSSYRWSEVFAANGTINTSDQRLKENIATTSYGLTELLALSPISFTWIDAPEQGTKLGLLAQDVQLVLPEIVQVGDDEAQTLGVRYTEIIPVIINSIKDLWQVVTGNKEAIAELEARIEQLENELDVEPEHAASATVEDDSVAEDEPVVDADDVQASSTATTTTPVGDEEEASATTTDADVADSGVVNSEPAESAESTPEPVEEEEIELTTERESIEEPTEPQVEDVVEASAAQTFEPIDEAEPTVDTELTTENVEPEEQDEVEEPEPVPNEETAV